MDEREKVAKGDDAPQATSWGTWPVFENHWAVRRYCKLLDAVGNAGEVAAIVLGSAAMILSLLLIFGTNLENYHFMDGTDMVCGYDGNTDQVFWIDPNSQY